jgi:ParB-like chromosome segregation protein Spo0J
MQEKVCLPQEALRERTVLALPCNKLVDHPLRLQYYNQAHLTALTASIKANRLLEPILAQPLEDGKYQILNGHYRIRAVRRLRHKAILSPPLPL